MIEHEDAGCDFFSAVILGPHAEPAPDRLVMAINRGRCLTMMRKNDHGPTA